MIIKIKKTTENKSKDFSLYTLDKLFNHSHFIPPYQPKLIKQIR